MIRHLKLILLACVTVLCSQGFAQNINGKITDSLSKAIPFASVTIKTGGNIIVAYALSNNLGVYTLQVPADAPKKNLLIEVTCVGFIKQSKPLTDLAAPNNFKLKTASNQLKAITIKGNRPVLKVSGDTTSYRVADFSNPNDRVIGDVIKKLPGVDVAKDGKISYNGKAISNLYIGGDNLLDDKYNIATNTIPNGVVDQVQVIENHQPVKMLQDKVASDAVALNLTMKKDAKMQLVGQETLGAGLPGYYFADLNGMMFKDQYKAINYLKGNNTGNELQNDLISHNMGDYLGRIDNDKPATILSLGTVGDPDLPRNRYLFNQAAIGNLNNLVHLKKDVLLRASFYYLHDTQKQNYQKASQIFLPNETISYNESQLNSRNPDIVHGQLLLNVNKDKYYLNNSLLIDYSQNSSASGLITNGSGFNQSFKDNPFDFSNEFNLMQTFKSSRIIEVYSYVNRISEPETRVITPGLSAAIFNQNVPYQQLIQNSNVPSWFTNNYVAFKIPATLVTQSYKLGGSLQWQTLTSDLSVLQNNNVIKLYKDSAQNNLNWTRQKLYTEATYDLPGPKFKATFTFPLSLQQTDYNDGLFALNKSLTRLYFNPIANMKYYTGVETYFTAMYRYRNNIGNIADVYRGMILTNYRTLYANNADLTESKTQTAALGFNYRKAITLLFFSVNASFNHIASNNITAGVISNSLQQRIVLPYQNTVNSYNVGSNISKYSFGLRTTFSAGVAWQWSRSNQILNNLVLPYNTVSNLINAGFDTKVSNQINISYKASFNQIDSKLSNSSTSSMIQQAEQVASVNYNPVNTLSVKLSGDHYYTRQSQANDLKYLFADLTAKYKFNKIKTDIELSAVNLFDAKTYSALYLSANTFTSNTYVIPGRMFLMKVYFNI